jgi:hypothetical protein
MQHSRTICNVLQVGLHNGGSFRGRNDCKAFRTNKHEEEKGINIDLAFLREYETTFSFFFSVFIIIKESVVL